VKGIMFFESRAIVLSWIFKLAPPCDTIRALAKRSCVERLWMVVNPMEMTESCKSCAHCVINKSRKTEQNGRRDGTGRNKWDWGEMLGKTEENGKTKNNGDGKGWRRETTSAADAERIIYWSSAQRVGHACVAASAAGVTRLDNWYTTYFSCYYIISHRTLAPTSRNTTSIPLRLGNNVAEH
jgi:hypothetical protein